MLRRGTVAAESSYNREVELGLLPIGNSPREDGGACVPLFRMLMLCSDSTTRKNVISQSARNKLSPQLANMFRAKQVPCVNTLIL